MHPTRYPVELIDTWTGDDGIRYTIRPVLPQDHGPLGQLVMRMSRQSRRRRFHCGVRELSDAALTRMTQLDYRAQMGLVVTIHTGTSELVVADARYCVDPGGEEAEFALMVDDAFQRCGLGLRAMHLLGVAAARHGLRWLHGSVVTENVPMLALMRRCGFRCATSRSDERCTQVEKLIDAAALADYPPQRARWRLPRWWAGVAAWT